MRERTRALADAGTLAYETLQLTSDQQRMPVEVTARIVDIGGRRLCLTVSHSIAAHKELEESLRSLTDVDELTGLLNRRGFFVKVDEMRRRARRSDRQVLLMYFDVDGLKRVNDEKGHAHGDKLLVAAADVLRAAFRERDVVARLGGDEFVAMALLGRRHDEQLDRESDRDAPRRSGARKRAELGRDYDFSVSFGSMVANHVELEEIDELLARADQQMYEVKRARHRDPSPGSRSSWPVEQAAPADGEDGLRARGDERPDPAYPAARSGRAGARARAPGIAGARGRK